MPQVWEGPRTGNSRRAFGEDRIRLSNAPRDRASGARLMPDLRHGAGAQDRDFGRTSQSRARPYDAAVLDLCRTESADRFSRPVRFNSPSAGPTQIFSSSIELVTACS